MLKSEKDADSTDILIMYRNRLETHKNMSLDSYFYKCLNVTSKGYEREGSLPCRLPLYKSHANHAQTLVKKPLTDLLSDNDWTIDTFERMVLKYQLPSSTVA